MSRRSAQRSLFIAIISLITATLAGTAGLFVVGDMNTLQEQKAAAEKERVSLEIRQALARALEAEKRVKELSEALNQKPSADPGNKLAGLESELKLQSDRLKKLEDVIVNAPEKVLAMPLLRKDLDAERQANTREFSGLHAEVARLYDFIKTFLGVLITIAMTIFAATALPALASRIWPAKKDSTSEKKES